jgi:hypothetical protein
MIRILRPLMRIAGGLLYHLFRVVPRSRRFALVARLITVTTPMWRLSPGFRKLMQFGWNNERDVVVRMMLSGLSRRGILYDPPFVVHNGQLLAEALRSGRGTVVVGTHRALNFMTMRYLYSLGHLPAVIGWRDMLVAGTRVALPVIRRPSSTSLVRTRTLLRQGGVVCAAIDHQRTGERTSVVQLQSATLQVSEALMLVAERAGAQVTFVATAMGDDGRLHIYFGAPRNKGTDQIRDSFGEFMRAVEEQTLSSMS